jgi:hypothetical protein
MLEIFSIFLLSQEAHGHVVFIYNDLDNGVGRANVPGWMVMGTDIDGSDCALANIGNAPLALTHPEFHAFFVSTFPPYFKLVVSHA